MSFDGFSDRIDREWTTVSTPHLIQPEPTPNAAVDDDLDDVRNPVAFLIERWKIIVVTALVGGAMALVGAMLSPKVYSVAADYTVSPAAAVTDPNDVLNAINTLDSRNRAFLETAADVFESQPVIDAGLEALQLGPDVLENVEIESGVLPSAIIVRLSASGPDPEMVTNLVVKVGNAATEKVESLYPLYTFELLEPPPLPRTPTSPAPVRDTTVGLVLGLVAGIGLAYAIDNRL